MAFYVRMDAELRRRGRGRADYALHLARRLDRRRLLTRAWAIARAAAARFGGLARPFIAGAMTQAWAERRRYLAALA